MATIIDIMTRLPLEEQERSHHFAYSFKVPRQERLIFDIDPMPKRMVRIAATVPGDCMDLLMDAYREALIQAGKIKVKPASRRAAK